MVGARWETGMSFRARPDCEQMDKEMLRDVLIRAGRCLARGRTVGRDWQKAALEAEDMIADALRRMGVGHEKIDQADDDR